MSSPRVAGPPPKILDSPDPHSYIAKRKQSLRRTFGWRKMEPLLETCDLAWYLVALDRLAEADQLASEMGDAIHFDGNYNVWTPACLATALAARLARITGDQVRNRTLVSRLQSNPAYKPAERAVFDRRMDLLRTDLRDIQDERSEALALKKAARIAAVACYFRETTGFGFIHDGWANTLALETAVAEALAYLQARLNAHRRPARSS